MSRKNKQTLKTTLTFPSGGDALAALFRLLGRLSTSSSSNDLQEESGDGLAAYESPLPLDQLRRCEARLRQKKGEWHLSLRVELRGTEGSVARPEAQPFKALKKAMRRTVKTLWADVQQDRLPSTELRSTFRDQCRQMTLSAPSSDPAYAKFEAMATALLGASTCEEAARSLKQLRAEERACHRRLK